MAELLHWWNLVYVLAFVFAFLYALLNAIGLASGASHADVGADADADVDAHIDVDHDVGDLGLDADADVEAHVDVEAHAEVEAQIAANKEVQIQMATAVGTMLASAKMQLFGDPSTLASMYGQFLKSVGWGLTVDGLMASTPESIRDAALRFVSGTGSTLRGVVSRLVGGKAEIDPKVLEDALVEAIAKAKGAGGDGGGGKAE